LLSAIRGCDGLPKRHPSKKYVVWLRRCVLRSAFTGEEFSDPYEDMGGTFTGPCDRDISQVWADFASDFDNLPLHFFTHLMHATEILGYKYKTASQNQEDERWRLWWRRSYLRMAKSLHLHPESEEEMDQRLGDNERKWKQAETNE
ncbi:MAG: hypothetical protein KDB07_10725, partial [Planctomycetes bacterium]|nr:hypothetical protein [Planctomycetota bacterium]